MRTTDGQFERGPCGSRVSQIKVPVSFQSKDIDDKTETTDITINTGTTKTINTTGPMMRRSQGCKGG